jgi:hypothetical protein
MKRFISVKISVLLALLLLPMLVFGQQVASVTGVVTDTSGAVVQGVEVKLTDTKTNAVYKTKTNDLGVYLVSNVPPGPGYTMTFAKDGFKTNSVRDVYLGVGVTHTLNAQIEVGSVSQVVEVRASGEASLNTTDASVGNVVNTDQVAGLPIQIRGTPAALLGLQPGVMANSGGGTNRSGAVTGSRTDQGNITIDGIDANDVTTGQAFATVGNAAIDSVQEVRTVTANGSAGEGRSSGGQIEIVTKSGTNGFHGNARWYNRNTLFAANSFFNNKSKIARPVLNRNQFGGSVGGPILKDKLFFFFDYEGRRDASGVSYSRTVPLDFIRAGGVAYINNGTRLSDGKPCDSSSRSDTTPECITRLTAAQVQALDPLHIGADPNILSILTSRYPLPNDIPSGNGVTTGIFRFNAPSRRADNTYTSRLDWKPTQKHSLFARFNFARRDQDDIVNNVAQQFPGDPTVAKILVKDYAYALGWTWTINNNMVNQATYGVSRSGLEFPTLFQPTFPNSWTFGPISNPFPGFSSQTRFVPVPTIRDDFSWTRGTHLFQFGGTIKPIRQNSSLTNDFNFVTVGLGGNLGTLDPSVRPANILNTTTATGQYDSMFAFLLGHAASVATNFNYNTSGQAQKAGTGKSRNFHYNEYEFYGQDTWKLSSSLTLTYGLRWQYYSPPFEANGFQSVVTSNVDLSSLFTIREHNGLNGIGGANAEPLLTYNLGGPANNAPGYYQGDWNNFAPRLNIAYNPSFKNGFLGKLFGDRKTVLRMGGSMVYDRVGGALSFIADQVTYLFDNSNTINFGSGGATAALTNDPRFVNFSTLPGTPVAPTVTRPNTPFFNGVEPIGNQTGETNYLMAKNFKIPYAYVFSFGIQRELPGNFLLEANYVGRLGHSLWSQADGAQIVDFKDNTSGQFMLDAFNKLQQQIIALTPSAGITAQPWFENQMNAAIASNFGAGVTCVSFFNPASVNKSCTRLVRAFVSNLVQIGDVSDTVQFLNSQGYLFPNTGLSGQFSTNAYVSNLSASNYNGLLLTLRKRPSHGLQFDFNYTFSHSIDNLSSVTNTVFGGLVCDVRNLRVCRGNSDFDVRHIISANWLYALPFGKGRRILGGAPRWADAIVGGWEANGIWTWRTGYAFSSTTGSFPVGFVYDSPAVVTGSTAPLQANIHVDSTGTVQYFADNAAALGTLRNPVGGEIGNRNNLFGPHFWNVDLAVLKNFKMPWSEKQRLQFRWESFNLFNHPSFRLPSVNFNSQSTFGRITSEESTPRQMQFALRYEF